MKILFCLHHFLPVAVAGTEVYVYQLAKNLQELGQEVVIVIPNFDSAVNDEYEYEGLRIIKYGENSIDDRRMILGFGKPKGLNNFSIILKKEKPDLVHFNELIAGRGPNVHHVKLVYELGLPIVLTTHLTYYSCSTGKLLIKNKIPCDGEILIGRCTACLLADKQVQGLKATVLESAGKLFFSLGINPLKFNNSLATAVGIPWLIKRKQNELKQLAGYCAAIVSPAKFYKTILALNEVPPEKLFFVSQGLGLVPAGTKAKYSKTSNTLNLVYAGRITKIKGLHLLLEAMQAFPASILKLTVYGGYDVQENYYEACKELAATLPNVYFKGQISSSELTEALPAYDVLCIPSLFEMSPLVIQEAFAAGVPVLASDVYGNAEQITDGANGWLFNFNDSLDLGKKLQMLLDNPHLIEEARKQLPALKSFKEVAMEYLAIYKNVMEKANEQNKEHSF